ncbi:MAG: hypothetical protein IJH88_03715 [Eggerthellaceae bacterium]|nr:hypothetical protein [Eggerthellaceae bacterium]
MPEVFRGPCGITRAVRGCVRMGLDQGAGRDASEGDGWAAVLAESMRQVAWAGA